LAAAVFALTALGIPGNLLAQEAATEAPPTTLSLEQILERNLEARGGLEAWKAVKTLRMNGSVSVGGEDTRLTIEFKRPGKFRFETEVQDSVVVQAYDGSTAWALPPFGGEAVRMPEEQADFAKEQADFEGPLIDHEAKGTKLELQGREDVDGRNAYKLSFVNENGNDGTLYLDPETFLELRQRSRREIQGQEVDVVVSLEDYKKVGGIVVAHTIKQSLSVAPAPQVVSLDSVELNIDLPDDRFAFPDEG